MKYKAVFIDFDDTIWDFRNNSKVALYQLYSQFSLNRYYSTPEQFIAVYSQRNQELWALYHHERLSKPELVLERFRYPLQRVGIIDDALAYRMNDVYLDLLARQTRTLPYAVELLDYLSANYPLILISNGFREVQFKKLENSNLRRYFDHVVLSEEVGVTKPHPAIFESALRLAGVDAHEAIMIGDNPDADIVGAQVSGIDQIFYNPMQLKTDLEMQITFEVGSLRDIISIL